MVKTENKKNITSIKLGEIKERLTREGEPCLTVSDIVSIIWENQSRDISIKSLRKNVGNNLEKSAIQVKNNGQTFNLYPVDSVEIYLELLEDKGEVYFREPIDELVRKRTCVVDEAY